MSLPTEIQQDIIQHLEACQFRALSDKYFTDQFSWKIKGTSILSGTYDNIDYFFETVISRLSALIKPGWSMDILDTHISDNAMVIEMKGQAELKSGGTYNNEYCWIFKFQDNKLKSITAYYDSLLVNQTLNA